MGCGLWLGNRRGRVRIGEATAYSPIRPESAVLEPKITSLTCVLGRVVLPQSSLVLLCLLVLIFAEVRVVGKPPGAFLVSYPSV